MNYLSISTFALAFGREFFEIAILYREFQDYFSGLTTTKFNNQPPQKNFYKDFYPNREYLIRKHQNRYGFNRKTKICQRGLEIRLENQKIKRQKARREERIKRDFLYDNTKSRRWMKRHHVSL
jgi:hypothetical protein